MTISRNRGFSLTEQMVALAISCLAILGTMKLQTVLNATQLAGKDRAAALSLTQQVIETLRQSGYPPGYNRQLPLMDADSPFDTPVFCDTSRVQICLRARTTLLTATPSVTLNTATSASELAYADVQVSTRWSIKSEAYEVQLQSRIAATSMVDSGQLMLGQLPANLAPSAANATPPTLIQVDSTGNGRNNGNGGGNGGGS